MDSVNTGGGRMRIGVDAGCLGVVDERLKVGVYNVAWNLLVELSKIDHENTYYLYSFYPIEKSLMRQLGGNMHNVVVTPARGWMKIWLPMRLRQDSIDVFIALGQSIPAMKRSVKKIGYIYDIAFEKYPQYYPDSYKQLHAITSNLVKKSDHIITISEASKKDIREYFSLPNSQISAVHLGVRTYHEIPEKRVRAKYFLSVGALKRIKNFSTVLKAFALFSEKKKDYRLLIVGGDKWMDPDIKEAYNNLPGYIKEKIDFCGYVEDIELFHLYRHAEALIAPSYYEGFGLPVVEAMSLGCPVIVSNRGSLPEIVGDSGYITNPNDAVAIANSMIKITRSKSERALIAEKAMERASLYTWEECAKETLAIINKV